ncbi:MAG: hypothetical protein LBI31_02720 [Zoogloeaceae bacterium]|jgi:hypothetical protein|nr:hypothetical protein [Zoogloeaceae bacterium]
MAYSKESVIAAYKRMGNIPGACAETGCSPYIAYIWLRKEKLLTANDKRSYGTRNSKRAGESENEFQRLVPFAVDANKHLGENTPSFDFMVGEATIDVKYCGIDAKGLWRFQTARYKQFAPDFYCAFLAATRGGSVSEGYKILLIPHDLTIGSTNITVDSELPEVSPWWAFLVEPDALAGVLREAADGLREMPPVPPEAEELRAVKRIGRAIARETKRQARNA